MKRLVQVRYPQFSEVFEVNSEDDSLNVELKEIHDVFDDRNEYITLDLSTDYKASYSDFPFQYGDLVLIQAGNIFIVSAHLGENIHWLKFDSSQIISYLIKNPILDEIIPFVDEDNHIFLNSLMNDFIRNDYSFNEINKKIKYAKIAVLMSFLKDYLRVDYQRILLDETLLGDIEIENIPMSMRFSDKKILSVLKINNLSKVIIALDKNKEINIKYKFEEKVYFINNFDGANKVRLVLNENGLKYDYEVLPQKNYIFELGDKEYKIEFGSLSSYKVTGKVCVYNGDVRDLMIS